MLAIANQVSPITDAQFQNEKVDDERDLFIFRHCLFSFFRERERERSSASGTICVYSEYGNSVWSISAEVILSLSELTLCLETSTCIVNIRIDSHYHGF